MSYKFKMFAFKLDISGLSTNFTFLELLSRQRSTRIVMQKITSVNFCWNESYFDVHKFRFIVAKMWRQSFICANVYIILYYKILFKKLTLLVTDKCFWRSSFCLCLLNPNRICFGFFGPPFAKNDFTPWCLKLNIFF